MATLRRCRWCAHPLVKPGVPVASSRLREAHCANPACTWCLLCVRRREAASRAGYPLDVPVESPAEQTREIPAVQDEIPPDQMT